MRQVLVGLVLAACGGASKAPAPAEPKAAPVESVKAEPAVGTDQTGPQANLEPAIEEPPPPQGPPIWERLRVTTGPVPGLAAYSVALADSPNHCGGKQLVTTRVKKQKVPKSEQALAAYFAVEFPAGLDFTEGDKAAASSAKFDAWLTSYMDLGKKATQQYEGELASAKDGAGKVSAAARLAQISHRLAAVLAYAEVPLNMRTGEYAKEMTDAFCDRMAEVAEPLVARAEEAVKICAEKAKLVTVEKSVWWQQVCVTPAS